MKKITFDDTLFAEVMDGLADTYPTDRARIIETALDICRITDEVRNPPSLTTKMARIVQANKNTIDTNTAALITQRSDLEKREILNVTAHWLAQSGNVHAAFNMRLSRAAIEYIKDHHRINHDVDSNPRVGQFRL